MRMYVLCLMHHHNLHYSEDLTENKSVAAYRADWNKCALTLYTMTALAVISIKLLYSCPSWYETSLKILNVYS